MVESITSSLALRALNTVLKKLIKMTDKKRIEIIINFRLIFLILNSKDLTNKAKDICKIADLDPERNMVSIR